MSERKSSTPALHEVTVVHTPQARYPHSAACLTCGWRSWGYLQERIAREIADDHVNRKAREARDGKSA